MKLSRYVLFLALLIAVPAGAQHATRDSTLATRVDQSADSIAMNPKLNLRSRRGLARLHAAADTLRRNAGTAFTVRTDTLRITDTVYVTTKPDTTVVVTQPPIDSVKPPVVETVTTPAPTTTVGPAAVAELPRTVFRPAYPVSGRTVKVPLIANLQFYIDNAQPGDILALAPGAVYVGNFVLPVKSTSDSTWVVIRTDTSLTLTGTRMTPSQAASLRLAKIQTPSNAAAIATAFGAHHYRLVGLDVGGTSTANEISGIVRFGDTEQASLAQVAHHLVIDRSYIHGTPTQAVRRCLSLQSAESAIIDSWFGDCHSNNGDSQGVWGGMGPGPYTIANNHIEGGAQGVFFGGANPGIANLIPSDITVIGNYIMRPDAWRCTGPLAGDYPSCLPGQWRAKTLVETKNARRLLVEGNVIENVHHDAQVGFGALIKSENQGPDCSAPWSQSVDVTIRYNRLRKVANGFNLSARQGDCVLVPAAKFNVHDNIVEPFAYQEGTNGIPVQLLNDLRDLIFAHNTFATAGLVAVSIDGGPAQRAAVHSNVLPHGQYGVKRSDYSDGNSSLNFYMPSPSVFGANMIVGGDCSVYPATTLCPSTVPSSLPVGFDGRAIGADVSKVNAATSTAVVAP